jgi:serine/threonine-protein kinase HipA
MFIGAGEDGFKASRVAGCVERASVYHLTAAQAREIVDHQIDVIEREWSDVCDLAELPEADRNRFWRRQFLNPSTLYDYR